MSINTLVLDNPIQIDGKPVTELTYDATEISVELFATAAGKAADKGRATTVQAKVKETDYNLHLYLGMAAIIAINPNIDFSDLERIKGFDLLDLSNIGSFFIYRKSAEPSEQSSSEEQSGNMLDTSTRASEKSD